MHVVIVQRSAHPNTLGWVDGLVSRGHSVRYVVSLLTPKTPSTVTLTVVDNIGWISRLLARVCRLSSQLKVEILRPVRLWRALAHPRPDLVLLKTQGLSTLQASLFALLLGARRVSWSNNPPDRARVWRLLALTGIMPRRRIWITGGTRRGHLLGRHDRCIPYGMTVPDRPVPGTAVLDSANTESPVRFLTVGAFRSVRKRPWWTLDAAASSGLLDGRARFTFVGHRSDTMPGLARLQRAIADHHAKGLAELRFDVPHEEMAALYRQHDVLVLPSDDEPFGLVVFEAMVHGLPVVVSDAVGAGDHVEHGRDGFIFPHADLEALATALRAFTDDPSLAGRMGAAAREAIISLVSPERCARMIEEVAGV